MGAYEGTGDLIKGGRGSTIGGIPVAHSTTANQYYFQRGVLMVPNEALDELLQGLGRLGLGQKDAEIEPVGGTGDVKLGFYKKWKIQTLDGKRPSVGLQVDHRNWYFPVLSPPGDTVSIIFRVNIIQRAVTIGFPPTNDLIADFGIKA